VVKDLTPLLWTIVGLLATWMVTVWFFGMMFD
jgi:hypothetical protein